MVTGEGGGPVQQGITAEQDGRPGAASIEIKTLRENLKLTVEKRANASSVRDVRPPRLE